MQHATAQRRALRYLGPLALIVALVLALSALAPGPAGEFFHTAPAEAATGDYLPPVADAGRDFFTYVGLPTEFRGYGTALDDDIALYEWDFDGDGVYDFQSGKTGVTSYVFSSPGTYMAVLRVTDAQGNVATDTVRVVVRRGSGRQEYLIPTKVTPEPPPVTIAGDGVVGRYAVMINGGYETRFWNDVVFMYPTLTDDYGFPPERIYLFNHDGTNPNGINPDNMIDYPASLSDIDSVFTSLSAVVDDDDELFVWVTDHGRGYQAPYGYLDGFASVDPGDEQDYLESDFKLRSLCTYGDYADPYYNHGMEVLKVFRDYSSYYGAVMMYRNKFVSTFTDVYFEQSGTRSDNDIYIERLVDYLLGDTDRDGLVETDQGEVYDYDGDGNPPYDPGTGAFDEDDWGGFDYYDDNFNHINSGFPGDSYMIFDHNFDNRVDIDINYDPDNLEVDGTDLDNQGLFDGIDVNEDGDMDDWVSIDEKICLYDDDLLDDEMAIFLDRTNTNVISIFMEPCFSGGFIDDLSANNRVISTATEEETVSWGNLFVELFTSALHRATRYGTPVDADYDQNGCVSMMEAFNYAALNDTYDEIPQYDDNGDAVGHPYPIPSGGDGFLGAMTYLEECGISSFCDTVSEIPQIECEALVALYNSTDGPNWTDHSGWLGTIMPCTWYGVTCGGGQVTEMLLASNHLSGAIPPELGNLPNLLTLRLENNALGGDVPATITNLTNLTDTDLGYNTLTTSNPDVIAFLNGVDPDWANTQTVPPDDARIVGVSVGQGTQSVELEWTPIPYRGDGGYYEISYATTSGGPYTVHGTTGSKDASDYTVDDLPADPPAYYLVVRTHTPPHGAQQNALWSDYSPEMIAGSTEIYLPIIAKGD